MDAVQRFQRLIDHVNRKEDLEYRYKLRLTAGLEYFKQQVICDADRKDSGQKILQAWQEFKLLTKGSKLFEPFQKDVFFWDALEESVGIVKPKAPVITVKREAKPTEFFNALASRVEATVPESAEKKLLLFGLWCLQLEAQLARPFRSQGRIQMVYRYLHPRLQAKGILDSYKNDEDMKHVVQYFVKGSML